MEDKRGDVTQLLLAWTEGDRAALERLIPLVYDELRRIAKRSMGHERPDHTFQPTELVNQLYLRLVDRRRVNWRNRAHFFGTAAGIMRQILMDHARERLAKKRGKDFIFLALDEARDVAEKRDLEWVALDDALKDLAKHDERRSRVVEMRFFAGMTYEEIGEVLRVSDETAKRDFRLARVWLREHLGPGAPEEQDDETG